MHSGIQHNDITCFSKKYVQIPVERSTRMHCIYQENLWIIYLFISPA